ncbi:MAG: cytidylate kinase [Holosporaceae bacterium]|nr:cytidylate kinase [Holosporaceae bacterium]
MKKIVIAIDGPACSGKGTIARLLASHFNFTYLDTGLLYRGAACVGIDKINDMSVFDLLKICTGVSSDILRSDAISAKASDIAKLPKIRPFLTKMQRDFVENSRDKGFILDGRDIGTVVFPNADCKFFITANLETRASRRFEALKQNNPQITYDEVYQNLLRRDEQDSSRKIAPLFYDESYTLIDTSHETINESFLRIVQKIPQFLR